MNCSQKLFGIVSLEKLMSKLMIDDNGNIIIDKDQRRLLDFLTDDTEWFNAEIEKGFNDLNEGKVVSSKEVRENILSKTEDYSDDDMC